MALFKHKQTAEQPVREDVTGVLDMPFLLLVVLLLIIGLVMMFSASYARAKWDTGNPAFYFVRQALFAVGGLAGFLCYNFHPAKVFMGDTGSLFLGGAVCGMAFALNMPLILILVGLVYIVEAVSVILQVGYFKLTKHLCADHKGRRIFKMTPIHHHFEMCGWSEVRIWIVFVGVSAVMCLIAWFATAPLR